MPFLLATALGTLVSVIGDGLSAETAVFTVWGVGWAVVVGLVSLRRRWDSPALLPCLSLAPLWLHVFTAIPVGLETSSALLLIILIAVSRARTARQVPSASPDSLDG